MTDQLQKASVLGGYITSPNLFIRNSGNPDPEGILSEVIFGPTDNYKCSCGFLKSKALDGGKLCPKCNVYCDSNKLRLETFGKIKMVFPCFKPTKINKILKIITKEHKQLLDPKQADASSVLTRYIAVNGQDLKIVMDLNQIEPGWTGIPFRITGLYTLIFVLKYCAYNLNMTNIKSLFDEKIIFDELNVLPPEIRPVFRDPKKPSEIRRTQVNDYYISILNLNKRNEILNPSIISDEEVWIDTIKFNLQNNLTTEEIVESIALEYDRIAVLYQYYINEIYSWAFESLSGKKGLIRSNILARTIEFIN